MLAQAPSLWNSIKRSRCFVLRPYLRLGVLHRRFHCLGQSSVSLLAGYHIGSYGLSITVELILFRVVTRFRAYLTLAHCIPGFVTCLPTSRVSRVLFTRLRRTEWGLSQSCHQVRFYLLAMIWLAIRECFGTRKSSHTVWAHCLARGRGTGLQRVSKP